MTRVGAFYVKTTSAGAVRALTSALACEYSYITFNRMFMKVSIFKIDSKNAKNNKRKKLSFTHVVRNLY